MVSVPVGRSVSVLIDCVKEAGASGLEKAIVLRSRPQLQGILHLQAADILGDTAYISMPPLHLATDWSEGLSLLLEAGANVNTPDHWGIAPISYAIHEGVVQSISHLLASGSAIQDFGCLLLQCFMHGTPGVDGSACEMTRLLIVGMAARRAELQDMATTVLPQQQWYDAGLKKDRVLDFFTCSVVEHLKLRGVDIPASLSPSEFELPIYCFVGDYYFNSALANKLWVNGFRDIDRTFQTAGTDEFTARGAFDLILNKDWVAWVSTQDVAYFSRQLDLAEWLVDHGAMQHGEEDSLYRHLELAARLGCLLSDYLAWCECSDEQLTCLLGDALRPIKRYLLFLLGVQQPHFADCGCCWEGCNGVSKIFQHLHYTNGYDTMPGRQFSQVSRIVTKVFSHILDGHRTLSEDLIRAAAFETFDMRHSCWRLRWTSTVTTCRGGQAWVANFLDADEILEIQDEDYEATQRFHDTVERLIEAFQLSGLSLPEFFEGPFWQQVEEVKASESANLVDVDAVRRLGVWLKDVA